MLFWVWLVYRLCSGQLVRFMVFIIYLQSRYVEITLELTNCFLVSTWMLVFGGDDVRGWVPGRFNTAGPNFVAWWRCGIFLLGHDLMDPISQMGLGWLEGVGTFCIGLRRDLFWPLYRTVQIWNVRRVGVLILAWTWWGLRTPPFCRMVQNLRTVLIAWLVVPVE